jgi:hypothetical protein
MTKPPSAFAGVEDLVDLGQGARSTCAQHYCACSLIFMCNGLLTRRKTSAYTELPRDSWTRPMLPRARDLPSGLLPTLRHRGR